MEDFVKRMIKEQKELSQVSDILKDRIDKIETFLNTKGYVLTETEFYLLTKQYDAMKDMYQKSMDYYFTLLARIALYENFDKKEKNNEEI